MRLIQIIACLVLGGIMNSSAFAAEFSITSNTFSAGQSLPKMSSCDGSDQSPQLAWDHAPNGTQSFALILSDPDAPGGTWYHWVVYNIPGETKEFSEGIKTFPAATQVGKNSWGKAMYNGPCPPKGTTHHYIFTIYALSVKLNLSGNVGADELVHAMQEHILGQAQLIGMFNSKKM